MIINAKIDQSVEMNEWSGDISREFQRSPRRFFNARNLPTRSTRMLTSLFVFGQTSPTEQTHPTSSSPFLKLLMTQEAKG